MINARKQESAVKMIIIRAVAIFALSGCSPSPSSTNNVRTGDIGHFQFHEASNDLPALVLDTTSGCLSHVVQTEKTTPKSDWAELNTEFAKWQCPIAPVKPTK